DKSQDRDILQGIFGGVQRELNDEEKRKEHGKIRFKGNAENGKVAFEKIVNSLSATERENFHFYFLDDQQPPPDKNQNQPDNNSQNPPPNPNNEKSKNPSNSRKEKLEQEIKKLKENSVNLTEQQKNDLKDKEK